MASYPTYLNAPITEAILDIRASLPPDICLEQLATFHAKIEQIYPDRHERIAFQGSLKIAPTERRSEAIGTGKVDGYLFRSSIEGKVIQARLDGFTFNKLKPYESWNAFSSEARRMWRFYCEIAKPVKITRCSLRYINKVVIPSNVDTKEYFLTGPEISPALPQTFRSFFMRLEIPDDKGIALGIIHMATQPADETGLPIIFDIDVVKQVDFLPTDESLWVSLEELRDFKNRLFHDSLTGKTREMFK
ncbi:MAG: TIGR04255 family protein [Syntrophales bacterium]